ncbi:reverse transcriptase family protein [Pseudomonas sp. NFACC37-1]|uniref:reverse transcriptase family protein n=1 Tax=Pseudomonas sp. NFACC37-1 TaxID=1566196 RepID=UPI00088BDF8B|nr:reverse transcriptase family protein [Pseudomonas sp. NFACC37-1]SCY97520.1 Reverse transcriptase (RNA-dependent DNA polymerase) [Pseudomonas sp. NFACC37-1]
MTATKIDDIHTLDDLSLVVGVKAQLIQQYVHAPCQADYYQIIRIAKRGKGRRGEYREVYKAKEFWLAQLHRSIAMIIANSVQHGQHVQGFVYGRSTLTNAQYHLLKKIIVHADIKNFFNAITESQVEQAFLTIGGHSSVAHILARVSTIDGRLLQGTRCSPAVSNIVCRNLDLQMLEVARVTSSVYTRYADNITFSGDKPPSSSNIEAVVKGCGFELQGKGCYTQHRGARQFVTGLSVVDDERPRLPKQMKKKLRLIAHFVKKYGDEHFEFSADSSSIAPTRTQLEGLVAYAYSIEPQFAKKIWSMIN